MKTSKSLVPGLEFLGGVFAGALLVLLPVTPLFFIVTSALLVLLWAHMLLRILAIVGMRQELGRGLLSMIGVALLIALLVWGYSVRFSRAATPPVPSTPSGGNVSITGSNFGNACTNGAKCSLAPIVKESIRDPHALYQDGAVIGTTSREPVFSKSEVVFGNLRMTAYLDPSKPVIFRGMSLSCPEKDTRQQVGDTPMYIDVWTAPTRCEINLQTP